MSLFNFRGRMAYVAAGILLTSVCAFQHPIEEGLFQRVVKSLNNFYGTSLPEKAYLHLDRPFYASGETIWLKAYVVEADSHRPDTLSKVLYVDLLSAQQRLVAHRTLRLKSGLAHADIALPDTLPAGTYQLRAYTSWMRNAGTEFFFTRPLAVVSATAAKSTSSSAKPDVQFFPEGGNLVNGLESQVGFRGVDASGHGVEVKGSVLDAQNHVVTSFNSQHLGMGSFRLTPTLGQRYHAVVALPGGAKAEYPLPMSQPAGYTFQVSETADDFLVLIRRRLAEGAPAAGPALLLAQVRGKTVFAGQLTVNGTAASMAKLPKSKFLPGLAHITLFDEQGTAQCERLVFTPNPPGVRLTLAPNKQAYAPREAVRLRLTATDAAGQPVAGNFSMAVTAQALAGADGPTIVSHLLLSSDLAGVVEDPGYYFREPQNPETQLALNNLLLTQGWRRFVWKELLAGQLPKQEFALEQGLSVTGQVLTAAKQPAVARQVAYLQSDPTREAQMLTDAAGRFRFRGLDGLDTTQVMLRAQPTKGERELSIRLLAPPAPAALVPEVLLPAQPDYVRRSQQQHAMLLTTGQPVELNNVNVRGTRTLAPTDNATRPYSNRNAVVLQIPDPAKSGDSRNIFQYLQGRIAGVTVSGSHINIRQISTLHDRSTGSFKLIEPLYLIDGNVVSADQFASYPLREVQTIDVMNQNAAGMFGTQAYGGVIAVYSRKSMVSEEADPKALFTAARTGTLSVQVPGYYRAREFYTPRYPAAATQPDPRYTTLYWAPEIRTDASGQAELSFYTSDATGPFQAIAEGLSTLGTPMRGSTVFVVQERSAK